LGTEGIPGHGGLDQAQMRLFSDQLFGQQNRPGAGSPEREALICAPDDFPVQTRLLQQA
jgi:hypothetical protein